jgi:hypothetical protein
MDNLIDSQHTLNISCFASKLMGAGQTVLSAHRCHADLAQVMLLARVSIF